MRSKDAQYRRSWNWGDVKRAEKNREELWQVATAEGGGLIKFGHVNRTAVHNLCRREVGVEH